MLGGFDPARYTTERLWATAPDGTRVPLSLVYRTDLAKLDGTDPLLLDAYGSYEAPNDPDFRSSRLSLLDRGVTFAIAHVRGGGAAALRGGAYDAHGADAARCDVSPLASGTGRPVGPAAGCVLRRLPDHMLSCAGEMGRRWYEDGKYLKVGLCHRSLVVSSQ